MKLNEKSKTILRIAFVIAVLVTIGMFWYDEFIYYFGEESVLSEKYPEGSNVAIIQVYGHIVGYEEDWEDGWLQTSSETFVDYIDKIPMCQDCCRV